MKYINPYKMFNGSFVPDWLECRPEISPGAKLVYARLARFSGKDGVCNPPLDLVAEKLGTNVRQIIRHIKELTNPKAPLIESKRNGRGIPNNYYFLYHPWMVFRSDDLSLVEVPDLSLVEVPDLSLVEVTNPATPYNDKENHLRESFKETEVVSAKNAESDFPLEFENRWKKYPMKDGKKEAVKHWRASVKTEKDIQDFDMALSNYLKHLESNPWKPPKNGKTFFNNWRDWIDWIEPFPNEVKEKNGKPILGEMAPDGTKIIKVWQSGSYRTESGNEYIRESTGSYRLRPN